MRRPDAGSPPPPGNSASRTTSCEPAATVPLAFDPILAFYAVPLIVVWTVYLGMRKKVDARSRSTQAEAKEAGLTEPASLHPLIDPVKCLGCGACVRACPEYPQHTVLGLINSKAQL